MSVSGIGVSGSNTERLKLHPHYSNNHQHGNPYGCRDNDMRLCRSDMGKVVAKWILVLLFGWAMLAGALMVFGSPLVLMSAMEGRLTDAGSQPAANIRLVRSWDWAWRNLQGQDETTTDEDGFFRFPAVTGNSLTARLLPHEPSVRQRIMAHHPTGPIEIWLARKGNYDDNGELQGRPLRVLCDLADPPGDDQRLFASLCVAAPATY
ncbi:MAG: carboxypeptidase regulatory-like domain-containing protein [Wenzhouxiangella sp.]|nr:carboxypeptidase regulatory-like domain-containing protein [Wenzhouxiangella sp.]